MPVQLQPYEREVRSCAISNGVVHVGGRVRYTLAHIERLRLVLPQVAREAEGQVYTVRTIVEHRDAIWASILIEPAPRIGPWAMPNTLELVT